MTLLALIIERLYRLRYLHRGEHGKVDGEIRTDIQNYHEIVAVIVVSAPIAIPLGVRFQKNGEGEVACALALLQDLVVGL